MLKRTHLGLTWYEFPHLAEHKEIVHGTFTRLGGVSKFPFDTLNLDETQGDDPKSVAENRKKICQALGIGNLAWVKQVHGTDILILDRTLSKVDQPLGEADALITDQVGIGLMVRHADCQPTLIFDPVRKVIAAIHCGWRGLVQNIYAKVVQTLITTYNCNPQDLLAGIGPSLGPERAEFRNYQTEFPKSFWSYQVKPNQFDLWAIGRDQLLASGLRPDKVVIANLCTLSAPDEFFSHRHAVKNQRSLTPLSAGRGASVVSLLQD